MDGRGAFPTLGGRAESAWRGRLSVGVALMGAVVVMGLTASAALANAPQPTSLHVDSEVRNGSSVTVTISGTWTWDQRVPTGPQSDCNDQRAGVGYAIDWGDNAANPLKAQNNTILYVGDAGDNWVHSVSESPWSLTPSTGGANMTFDGPFKNQPPNYTVNENMTGETADAIANGFGPQGIPNGTTSASPVKNAKYQWLSNCGPTAQSTLYGQMIGNSNPGDPSKGYPNGQWGPISHTYTTSGPYTICPVMYDPHAGPVGTVQTDPGQLTAGGQNANGDNSVQSNNNPTGCPIVSTVPPPQSSSSPPSSVTPTGTPGSPGFTVVKRQSINGSPFVTTPLTGSVGQVVYYTITVTNTGNTTLTITNFSDPRCQNITPKPGSAVTIYQGSSFTYTCSHQLTKADKKAGSHSNAAAATAGGVTHRSNKVVVRILKKAVKARVISRPPRAPAGFTG